MNVERLKDEVEEVKSRDTEEQGRQAVDQQSSINEQESVGAEGGKPVQRARNRSKRRGRRGKAKVSMSDEKCRKGRIGLMGESRGKRRQLAGYRPRGFSAAALRPRAWACWAAEQPSGSAKAR